MTNGCIDGIIARPLANLKHLFGFAPMTLNAILLTFMKRPSTVPAVAITLIFTVSTLLGAVGAERDVEWKLVQKGDRGFKIPQISGYKEEITRRVNRTIDDATKNLKCDSDISPRKDLAGSEFDVKMEVDYASRDVFSIYATMSYFCGTAYPTNDATFSMTFDLVTGSKIEFEDLFTNYAENKEKILRSIFAAQIKNADHYDESKDDGNCANSDVFKITHLLDTSEYDFTFASEGLRVQPRWPHVIEVCAERVTVPFEKLQAYARPENILARVANRQEPSHTKKVVPSDKPRQT